MTFKNIEAAILAALPQDKCVHALAGALLYAIAHTVCGYAGVSGWFAVAIVCVAALAKEALDATIGGDVSAFDVLSTLAGGAIGLLASAPHV